MKQLDFILPLLWFMGLNMDEADWDYSALPQNRNRLLTEALTRNFFIRVVVVDEGYVPLPEEQFTVDDSFIESRTSRRRLRERWG